MDGSPAPREWELMQAIRQYGAQAVMGRPLGAGEIRRMNYIEYERAEHIKKVQAVLRGE